MRVSVIGDLVLLAALELAPRARPNCAGPHVEVRRRWCRMMGAKIVLDVVDGEEQFPIASYTVWCDRTGQGAGWRSPMLI